MAPADKKCDSEVASGSNIDGTRPLKCCACKRGFPWLYDADNELCRYCHQKCRCFCENFDLYHEDEDEYISRIAEWASPRAGSIFDEFPHTHYDLWDQGTFCASVFYEFIKADRRLRSEVTR